MHPQQVTLITSSSLTTLFVISNISLKYSFQTKENFGKRKVTFVCQGPYLQGILSIFFCLEYFHLSRKLFQLGYILHIILMF